MARAISAPSFPTAVEGPSVVGGTALLRWTSRKRALPAKAGVAGGVAVAARVARAEREGGINPITVLYLGIGKEGIGGGGRGPLT